VLGITDRELEHVGERPRAELLEQEQPPAERAGHARGEQACSRDALQPACAVLLDRRRRGRDALRTHDERLPGVGRPEDDRQVAARPVQMRLDDLQDEPRGARGVERIATSLEHGHAGLRREPVRGRDGAERPAQLGPRRERHVVDSRS
jgi:hypothetical protein